MRRLIRAGRRNAAAGLSSAADYTEQIASMSIAGPLGKGAGKLLATPNRILAHIAKPKGGK